MKKEVWHKYVGKCVSINNDRTHTFEFNYRGKPRTVVCSVEASLVPKEVGDIRVLRFYGTGRGGNWLVVE